MRPCGECAACCQGWLAANIYGTQMGNGRACTFYQNKCTIYAIRPKTCSLYQCAWSQELFPEWMRPDKCKTLISVQNWSKGQYLKCIEMGEKIHDDVLLEITSFCKKHNTPYMMQYDGQWTIHGPQEFVEEVRNK
jgi:uncharacterized CHY-type Zn-finger protein